MAEIFPFRAYRYNPELVRLSDAVTQPYDKISPAMQQAYAKASPYNLVAVEKGLVTPADSPSNNVYTRAAASLTDWIRSGVLKQDAQPGIYVYSQEFTVPGSTDRQIRKGFIAIGRVEDYSAKVIFRHEQTLSGPKADRLELLRHTRTHTGQLFMLYTDPERRVDAMLDEASAKPAPAETRDEYGVIHRLWPIFDPQVVAKVVAAMASQRLVIADGHHRYETALAYRNECRLKAPAMGPDAPFEKVMMTLFNTRSPGWVILPTHRVVANLRDFDPDSFQKKMSPFFDQQGYSFGSETARALIYERFRKQLAEQGRKTPAIGMYVRGAFQILQLRQDVDLATVLPDVSPSQRRLDVVLLHRLILQDGLGITMADVTTERNITYEREMDAAIAAVDEGKAQVCFLLNSVAVEQVTELALAGEVLPQKSTDFFPKLMSGLTLYQLE